MAKLSKKKCFKAQLTLEFLRISRPTFPPSVTLVTAKKQHRCWKACAHACARESLPTLDTLCRKSIYFAMSVFHFACVSKEKVQFSAIFSLFALISMLIYLEGDVLGRVQKEVAPKRGVRCDQVRTRWSA